MNKQNNIAGIVGGGLAGLIAAHAWPSAPVFEAAPKPTATHRALLRFRTDAVSTLTGVEFRKVRVRKGIFYKGEFVAPNIQLANMYARKCTGRLSGDRSIWNIDPVDRFVAPDDLYERLVDQVGDRIRWDYKFDFAFRREVAGSAQRSPIVSTAPLPLVAAQLKIDAAGQTFNRSGIIVQRFHIPGADTFQTVYFPSFDTDVYRASITGSTLIVESIGVPSNAYIPGSVEAAFGLERSGNIVEQERVGQSFGKIVDIDPSVRKRLLFELTTKHGIYSLGRFATWRNILLDDVVGDIATVKRLLAADTHYEAALAPA